MILAAGRNVGKHLAKSIVIIVKWNQARAMYNVQRRGFMRIIKCSELGQGSFFIITREKGAFSGLLRGC